MSLSISQHVFNSDHRVPRLRSFLCALVERFLNRRNILIGDVLPLCRVLELASQVGAFITQISSGWLDVANNPSKLASTSALLLMEVVKLGLLGNSFSVVDGRVSNLKIDIVLSPHSLAVNEEMQFSHTRYDDLFTLCVLLHNEGRVFSLESVESLQERLKLILLSRSDCERHHWLWHVHIFHGEIDILITEGLS